jgi:hypothetical protein
LSHCPTPTARRITRRRWLVVGQYGAATTDARPRSYRPRPRGPASPPAPTRGTLVGPRIAGRPAWPDRPGSRPVRCSRPGRRARGSLEDTPTVHASRWRRGLERACASPFPLQQTRNPLRSVGLVARRAAVPAGARRTPPPGLLRRERLASEHHDARAEEAHEGPSQSLSTVVARPQQGDPEGDRHEAQDRQDEEGPAEVTVAHGSRMSPPAGSAAPGSRASGSIVEA